MTADERRGRVLLAVLPPSPTLEEIDDFVRQLTGKPMTPEDREETRRLLAAAAHARGRLTSED